MLRALALLLALSACSPPVVGRNLSLYDRFILTALTHDDGSPAERLRRWRDPIRLYYDGPDEFRHVVYLQARQLGEIANQPVEVAPYPAANLFVEISNRDTPSRCQVEKLGPPTRYFAEVHIWIEIPEQEIRQCIAQEMAHVLGPSGDLDGSFGSRQDTVFASRGGSLTITPKDLQVFRVLFDNRLRPGMPREEVLAILPEIVADVEAEQVLMDQ